MKRMLLRITTVLAVLVGLSYLGTNNSNFAQKPPNLKDPNVHFHQLKFNMALGETRIIEIPRKNSPVQINVSVTNIVENGVPSRPIVLAGWVAQDASTGIAGSTGFERFRDECVFEPEPIPQIVIDCGRSSQERVAARLVLPPGSSNPELSLQGFSSIVAEPLPVIVNLWF